MKKYPHPVDPENLEDLRQRRIAFVARQQPNVEKARQERNGSMFDILGGTHWDLAGYGYAAGQPTVETRQQLQAAVAQFATAWGFGFLMSPADLIDHLTLSLLAGETATARQLAALPRSRYTHPDIRVAEPTYLTAELASALVLDQAAVAADKLAAIREELTKKKIDVLQWRYNRGLVEMAAAALVGDQGAFDAAAAEHLTFFQKEAKRDSRTSLDARFLLDVRGLAFVGLAQARGLHYQGQSVYWPVELLADPA